MSKLTEFRRRRKSFHRPAKTVPKTMAMMAPTITMEAMRARRSHTTASGGMGY